MANRLMKRYSSQLIIRETQINTKIIYYLTPARMAIIKQTKNLQTITAGEVMEKRELSYTVDANINFGIATMEISMEVTSKTKKRATI